MSDLSDLYQEVILDHNRRPRNFGALADADSHAHGHNPLCGDRLTVFARMSGETIDAVQFEGSGCAISKASGSLMTEAVKGRTMPEVLALFTRFHALITGSDDPSDEDEQALGKLVVLCGVRQFPVRVKCASLAWHTLMSALTASAGTVKTE